MDPASSDKGYLLTSEATFRRVLLAGVLTPLIAGAVIAAVYGWQSQTAAGLRDRISQLREVTGAARELRAQLVDMETGVRGYLLTHNPKFLAPYESGKTEVQDDIRKLRETSTSFPNYSSVATQIPKLFSQWFRLAESELQQVQKMPAGAYDIGVQERMLALSNELRAKVSFIVTDADGNYTRERNSFIARNATNFWVLCFVVAAATALTTWFTWRRMRAISSAYHGALEAVQGESVRAKENAQLYKLITDNSGDLISIIEEGKYVFVSPSFTSQLGFESSELVGQTVSDFIHPDDLPVAGEKWRNADWSKSLNVEVRHRHKDGSWRWVDSLANRSENRFIGVGRDVTEKHMVEQRMVELNQELEQRVTDRTRDLATANKELEAFSYSVSHDLRAPLRSIASFSMILQEDLEGKLDAESVDNLSRIRAAAAKMTQLIDALLNFSRIARAGFQPVELDLSEMAETISEELHRRDPERATEIEIQPGLVAHADSHLIRAVLQNLLENAWKFTSTKPDAKIHFYQDESGFHISDNGVGFDQEYVEKVFLPFERLHTDREFPGTGIGLATVKRIIERHGGKIWAEGKPESGATFSFTL